MDYKIERITFVGKDKNLNYYYQTADSDDKMILDKETAFALTWQLLAEKMGVAFEEYENPTPREWTYAEVVDAAADLKK